MGARGPRGPAPCSAQPSAAEPALGANPPLSSGGASTAPLIAVRRRSCEARGRTGRRLLQRRS